jgi:hypothetical protein
LTCKIFSSSLSAHTFFLFFLLALYIVSELSITVDMAKGSHNNRGSPRGAPRGRPGRGGGRGRGRGQGRGQGQHLDDFSDFTIYDFMDGEHYTCLLAASNASVKLLLSKQGSMDGFNNSPRGRGRGGRGRANGSSTPRGGAKPPRGFDTPRGRGRAGYSQYVPGDLEEAGVGRGQGSPGRGRGRGGRGFKSKVGAGAPLSKILYEDRPLLRPITFVRSALTATLFQQEEEILQPLTEEVGQFIYFSILFPSKIYLYSQQTTRKVTFPLLIG